MVRSNDASSVLLVVVLLTTRTFVLTTAAVPKTTLGFQQMFGNHVEHRVDEEEAKMVARTLQPELSDGRPGCEVCTMEEIEYCTGSAALEDHCCCDLRHLGNGQMPTCFGRCVKKRSRMFLTHVTCGRVADPMLVTVPSMPGYECAAATTLQPQSGNHKLVYQLHHGGCSCSVPCVLLQSYNEHCYQS